MEIIKILGVSKDYLWGGQTLKKFGKTGGDIIAESWDLSLNKDGESIVDSGKDKGKKLSKVFKKKDWGSLCQNFPFFPTLIKYIDSKKNLSIQVHPSDQYALKYENSFGKTEMWFVVKANKNASLFVGLKKDTKKSEIKKALKEGKITSLLNKFKVKEGDCFLIPSGTIHAINEGCLILEIQQNSNLTYRLFDYNRKDKNGNLRELHIDKALKVIDTKKYIVQKSKSSLLFKSKYFSTYKFILKKEISFPATKETFMCLNFYEGKGKINNLNFKKGDSFLVPINNEVKILGTGKFLLTKIEK